jgi:hypothetical protein
MPSARAGPSIEIRSIATLECRINVANRPHPNWPHLLLEYEGREGRLTLSLEPKMTQL